MRWLTGFVMILALLIPPAAFAASTPTSDTCAGKSAAEWRAAGKLVIVGTDSADRLSGSWKAEVIIGGAGDDIITGNGGDDIICGGAGNDTITAGSGRDLLIGGEGDDTIRAGEGVDTIVGDCLTYPGEDDCPTSGADYIDAGGKVDYAIGDSGRWTDLLEEPYNPPVSNGWYCGVCYQDIPDDGNARLLGRQWTLYGDGNDTILMQNGGGGEWLDYGEKAWGGGGNDRIYGGDGDEFLFGGPGEDILYGDPGNDKLIGGPDYDVCDGGASQNAVYAPDPNAGYNTIDHSYSCEVTLNVEEVNP